MIRIRRRGFAPALLSPVACVGGRCSAIACRTRRHADARGTAAGVCIRPCVSALARNQHADRDAEQRAHSDRGPRLLMDLRIDAPRLARGLVADPTAEG